MKKRQFPLVVSLVFVLCSYASSQTVLQEVAIVRTQQPKIPTLVEAVMCERIEELTPINPGIVFSVHLGRVCCFNAFDPVPRETVIYHSWFHRDKLTTRIKLSLRPPQWSTFSSIQLRQADKGPWQVKIEDEQGFLFTTMRFSITE
jgi:hypothetical protein